MTKDNEMPDVIYATHTIGSKRGQTTTLHCSTKLKYGDYLLEPYIRKDLLSEGIDVEALKDALSLNCVEWLEKYNNLDQMVHVFKAAEHLLKLIEMGE